jgi:hypothetical protein
MFNAKVNELPTDDHVSMVSNDLSEVIEVDSDGKDIDKLK